MKFNGKEVTTKNGLLYLDGVMVMVPHADLILVGTGFVYAEQAVRQLTKCQACYWMAVGTEDPDAHCYMFSEIVRDCAQFKEWKE